VYLVRGVRLVKQNVHFSSNGDTIAGTLFLPENNDPSCALILCHGAMDFKEHYFEFCEFLAAKGIASLAIDMHGNGESQGERFHVEIDQWVADIISALDFLNTHPQTSGLKTGAFGLSSGGTAVLECAVVEPRIETLITLDATVRTILSLPEAIQMQSLLLLGWIKRFLTRSELRLCMVDVFKKIPVTADPEINARWTDDPRIIEMWSSWPIPGAKESIIVDTIKRIHTITAPTLVLHGAEDKIDPPETAHLLFAALTCKKDIHIIEGNGHVGHMDRNKQEVMNLTADWAIRHLAGSRMHYQEEAPKTEASALQNDSVKQEEYS
jgi:alpha-beta hydrolase superfamily lysophospholipase